MKENCLYYEKIAYKEKHGKKVVYKKEKHASIMLTC